MYQKEYDAIVIGAGMSGLACAIRLAMFDKKVCLLEKHTIPGGLNSYYQRGKRKFDVGLHALTNFADKSQKSKPLIKICKQLRIPYEELKLSPQNVSKITFGSESLFFTNDINDFKNTVKEKFSTDYEGFERLIDRIQNTQALVNENDEYLSARQVIGQYIKDRKLVDMILCPLLYYGSAWENDMDFNQFVIMFESIFLEGFSRPYGGVRTIIDILIEKIKSLNVDLRYRCEVESFEKIESKVSGVKLKSGEIIRAKQVFSSIGNVETASKLEENLNEHIGKLSFCESIFVLPKRPRDYDINETINFYNYTDTFKYQRPSELTDFNSAVVCFPNNFKIDDNDEGIARVTFMANYDLWKSLDKAEYKLQKERVRQEALSLLKKLYPSFNEEPIFHDVFSPTTIERYTSHFGGAVYGSTKKTNSGKTSKENLYLIGTDQGFLGIVGSLLSGISIANRYGLNQ